MASFEDIFKKEAKRLEPHPKRVMRWIHYEKLVRNKAQYREGRTEKEKRQARLRAEALADLIEADGEVLQELLVRRIGTDEYEIIAGHCRRLACKILVEERGKGQFALLPCIIKNSSDIQAQFQVYSSNGYSAKTDYEIMHELECMKHLLETYPEEFPQLQPGRMVEKLAARMNMKRTTVGEFLSISKNLGDTAMGKFKDGSLKKSAAVELASLSEEEQEGVLGKGLSTYVEIKSYKNSMRPSSGKAGGMKGSVPESGTEKPEGDVPESGTEKPEGSVPESGTDKPEGNVPEFGTEKPEGNVPESGTEKPEGSVPESGTEKPEGNVPESGTEKPEGNVPESGTEKPEGNVPESGTDKPEGNVPESGTEKPEGNVPESGTDKLERGVPESGTDKPERGIPESGTVPAGCLVGRWDEFIAGYASWPIWTQDPLTEETCYRHAFKDGSAIVVRSYLYTDGSNGDAIGKELFLIKPDTRHFRSAASTESKIRAYFEHMGGGDKGALE